MHTPRRGIALAVVDYNGIKCIFAIGGLDDTTCYNNVERYDPHSDTWKSVANLRIHRGGVCAVTYNGEVYAIGGNDGVQSKVRSDSNIFIKKFSHAVRSTAPCWTNGMKFLWWVSDALVPAPRYLVGKYTSPEGLTTTLLSLRLKFMILEHGRSV